MTATRAGGGETVPLCPRLPAPAARGAARGAPGTRTPPPHCALREPAARGRGGLSICARAVSGGGGAVLVLPYNNLACALPSLQPLSAFTLTSWPSSPSSILRSPGVLRELGTLSTPGIRSGAVRGEALGLPLRGEEVRAPVC